MYEDKTLACRECGTSFIFSASEQEFYAEKGFTNEPARCPGCRAAKKAERNVGRQDRQMFDVTCASCGNQTQVPFKPTGTKPVLCRDCFQSQRD